MKFLVCLITFLISFSLFGSCNIVSTQTIYSNNEFSFINQVEEWNITFGGIDHEWGWSVYLTNDNGFIISGETASMGNGNYDIILIKTDSYGEKQWEKTFGASGYDQGWCVTQTDDDGYIIAATSDSFSNGDYDLYLIKTDDEGNEIWSKTYGGPNNDFCHSIVQTFDSGYAIIGATQSYGAGDLDVYLLKIDGGGNELWSKTFGGIYEDNAGAIFNTLDGGLIIAGYTDSYDSGGGDVWIIKTDGNGNEEWSKTFGGNQMDTGMSVKQTSDNGFIIGGLTRSFGSMVQSFVIKTDSSGNEEWSKAYGGNYYEEIDDILQTQDNGFIFTGRTDSNSRGIFDVYFGKIDKDGNELWTKTLGGIEDDWGWTIQKTSDNSYVILGTTYSYGQGNGDIWLIKLNSNTENDAPLKPEITGSTEGKINTVYYYNSVTSDLNEDQLYYLFDWGDGNDSGWLGHFESGEEIEVSHRWTEKGNYEVKVKAKDVYGAESEWSDPLIVSMPNIPLVKYLLNKFIPKLSYNIKIGLPLELLDKSNFIFDLWGI